MIVEKIWAEVCQFLGWLLGLFPTVDMPGWITTVSGYLISGVATLDGLYNWVPLDAIRIGLTFVLGCSVVAISVRGLRIVISLFTGGGGGAA